MSEISFQLPPEYVPFEELIICSNTLTKGGVPIKIKDKVPLLVGNGEVPFIWLFATREGKEWQLVVDKNKSLDENIGVGFPKDGKSVLVTTGSTIIVHAIKLSEKMAEIDSLDLRPLGLDFHGNKAGLFVGTNLFTGNVFQGVAAMIAIG